jgi:3-hydroxyisobutyrate dehydrogenase-like beta-hydroxyacid dehydrogenase
MRVALLGLGIMGGGMAASLARKGVAATVWNRTPARAEEVARATGLRAAASVAEAVAEAQVILTCVADVPAAEAVAGAALAAARAGAIYVEMSTVSPAWIRRLADLCAARRVRLVEAPVSGSKKGAAEGTLTILAAASEADFAAARPVLEALGRPWRLGEVGAAAVVKLAMNAIGAATIEALGEAILLVRRSGGDPRILMKALEATMFNSPFIQWKGDAMLRRDPETHFSLELMHKDLTLALEEAHRTRTPLPLVAACREAFGLARAAGKGGLDYAAAPLVVADLCAEDISGRTGPSANS